jgi:hypothetical protein
MNYRAEITSSHKTNISAFCGSKRGYLMSLQTLARSGAIVSSAGVVLMVVFVVALLSFPVIKNCGESGRCTYRSTAPGELQLVVQPSFLAVSLITIAAGVLILRFSRWLESRKSENDINH